MSYLVDMKLVLHRQQTGRHHVKTTDGYLVRMFVLAFTAKRPDQVATNCFAQSAQIRKIRRRMVEIMAKEAGAVQLSPPLRIRTMSWPLHGTCKHSPDDK